MRFDNPIKKHKLFKMLDISEYSELESEFRQKKRIDLSVLTEKYSEQDLKGFNIELDRIISLSLKEKPFSEKEIELSVNWRKKLNEYFYFYHSFKVNSVQLKNNRIFDDLFNNGYSFQSINESEISFLKNRLKNTISSLLEKSDWTPPVGIFDRWVWLDDFYSKYLNNIFKNNGIIEAASAYYNKNLSVEVVRLTIQRTTDKSPLQFLYDCEKTPKHTNLHMDPKEGVVKAIVYLSKVTEDNCPCNFLPKSNRFIYDPIQNLFARAISTGSFCQSKDSRASIFRLPKKLRVSTNWGRLVKDGSDLEKYLSENLVKLTSDFGNTIVFDPGSGIHNGPIVKKGQRVALQIVMNEEGTIPSKN